MRNVVFKGGPNISPQIRNICSGGRGTGVHVIRSRGAFVWNRKMASLVLCRLDDEAVVGNLGNTVSQVAVASWKRAATLSTLSPSQHFRP